METIERRLNTFSTRVRQMILQHHALREENNNLYAMVDERDKKIESLENELKQAKQDYNNLKLAKMISISDEDIESAQKRLNKLLREVNKCITLLSEKQ